MEINGSIYIAGEGEHKKEKKISLRRSIFTISVPMILFLFIRADC